MQLPSNGTSEIELENNFPINIVTQDGEELSINFENLPQNGNVLLISIISSPLESSLSQVLSLNLYDEFGNEINQFSHPVELCFTVTSENKDACLNYYDEIEKMWVCSDPCLKKAGNFYWYFF